MVTVKLQHNLAIFPVLQKLTYVLYMPITMLSRIASGQAGSRVQDSNMSGGGPTTFGYNFYN